MAYTTMDSQFGYDIHQDYPGYQGLRETIDPRRDAQVAFEQAIYNAEIEQKLARDRYERQPALPGKISSLPAIRAPPAAYLEQRSISVDEGDSRKRTVNGNLEHAAQQEAFTKLTGETQYTQQQMVKARLEEESSRYYPQERKRSAERDEVQKYSDLPLTNHIAYQSTRAPPPPPTSGNHGLPASPRPDPQRRTPSTSERKPSSALSSRNPSVDRTYNVNGSFSDVSRKGSSALSTRSKSTDESASRSRSRPAPFETPRSASDAGLKTIKVICDQMTLKLPIVPTTTAMEILTMASVQLGEGFDQKRYILVESFTEVGSDRPVRYYERVKDVLKSWDNEEQNGLFIQPFHTQWEYESLDLYNAPKIVPSDMSTALYYSHRPESWHKWTFTLRADGQILMQKYKGGDAKAICHMKDFDIYVPTAQQLKRLAAPRKFCFAIKSQQKSMHCESASNFVHFFCTSEKDVASEWYRAVHGWRSYYLVHSIGLNEVVPLSSRPSISSAVQRNPSLAYGPQRKASEGLGYFPKVQPSTSQTMQRQASESRISPPNSYTELSRPSYNRSGSVNSSHSYKRSGSVNSGHSYNRSGSVDSNYQNHNRSGSINSNTSYSRSGSVTSNQSFSRSSSLASSQTSSSSSRNPSLDRSILEKPLPRMHSPERQPYPQRKDSSTSDHSRHQYPSHILADYISSEPESEPAPFAEYAISSNDYLLRKDSLASNYTEEPLLEGNTIERVRPAPMRKASSSSDEHRITAFPSAFQGLNTSVVPEEPAIMIPERKNSHAVMSTPMSAPALSRAEAASVFEWRFDPFTGQPLTRPSEQGMRKNSQHDRQGSVKLRNESVW